MDRSSKGSQPVYAVAANLSELELKKILIDKEGSYPLITCQTFKTLYKALLMRYEAERSLLETYGERSLKQGVHDEQAEEEVQHLPDWFQQPTRLPFDHDGIRKVTNLNVKDRIDLLSIKNVHKKQYQSEKERRYTILRSSGFIYENKAKKNRLSAMTNSQESSSSLYGNSQKTDHILKIYDVIRRFSLSVFQIPDPASNRRDLPRDIMAEIGSTHMLSVFKKMNSSIEERHHGPSDALRNPSQPFKFLSKDTCQFVTEINMTSIDFLTPSLLILKRVILFSIIHSDDGNPSSVKIKQHCVMRTSKYGKSNASALEDLVFKAGNPVKEVILN
ncbi:hypothetical protein Tco_0835988 [Tanacetum coccineum]